MVDGIIEEHNLCRLNKDRDQRQHIVVLKIYHTRLKKLCNPRDCTANTQISDNSKQHTDNTEREVIDKHLKACAHLAINSLIKLLDYPRRKWSHNHCTDKHRHICTNNNTRSGNSAYNTTTNTCHIMTRSITDK